MSRTELWIERGLGAFKWLLGFFMLYAGVITAIGPLTPMDGALGYIYSTRISLVMFGVWFFFGGAALLYGKWKRSKRWVGIGLMSIYLNFLFAAIIQGIAYDWNPGYWVSNAVGSIIIGLLWLRWKLKTEYINPNHFRKEIRRIRQSELPN